MFKKASELLDKNSERVFPAHTDPKKFANEFNHFYINKVKKIPKSISPISEHPDYFARLFKGEMMNVFEPTTQEKLSEIIRECCLKTLVEDPIPAKVIKTALNVLLPVYKILVSRSLAEGSMDTANILVVDPLIRKKDLDIDPYNHYRPVNNLIFFSKKE